MDRALYVALSGAAQTLRAQAANNHNLANASTTAFRAALVVAESAAVNGEGYTSRVQARALEAGENRSAGALVSTGRELDIALRGDGWLAVQTADGGEAYTRAGDLQVDADGMLRTRRGDLVLGDGGTIQLPAAARIDIGSDGSITAQAAGEATANRIGKLKVVSASADQLQPRGDGLYRARPGERLEDMPGATVSAGMLESSNVNAAEAMVTMIELSRHFELQTRAMKAADENAQQASTLLRMK